MNTSEALHTIAWQYCIAHHAYWVEAYKNLQATKQTNIALDELRWTYTDEGYGSTARKLSESYGQTTMLHFLYLMGTGRHEGKVGLEVAVTVDMGSD